jgi:Zn-dependent protease/predicted transcriptional regulator
MHDAWQIGRLFGIPLRVHISWLIVFGLISWSLAAGYLPAQLPDLPVWSYWLKAVLATTMFFFSIILHELGHSLVARHHGIGIASITLFVFGGVSQMKEEPSQARQELQIALVGPIISLGLAALFGVLSALAATGGEPTPLGVLLTYLTVVNLLVSVFNMLPAFPLDGGRVLRALLWWRSGDLMRATYTAARTGQLLALALIVLGVVRLLGGNVGGLWLMLIGWFIMQAGSASVAQASLRQALGGLRVRDVMTTEVRTVPAAATLHDVIENYFIRYTYGGYPVVDDGRVVGLVTLHELRNTPVEGRATTRVERVMVPLGASLVVDPGTPVVDALHRMVTGGTGRLVVLERDRLVGLITTNGIVHLTQTRSSLGG